MRRPRRLLPLLAVFLLIAAGPDPSATVVLELAVIYVTAVLFGELAVRIGQPAVLGELVGGMVLGNLHLLGLDVVEAIKHDASIDLLARIGVLLLLFQDRKSVV